MTRTTTVLVAILVALVATGCSSSKRSADKLLDATLLQYAKTMRWGELESVVSYLDPDYVEKHPITSLELERLRQLKVASYRARAMQRVDDGHVTQDVDIEVVNINTQQVRVTVDHQAWRYDEEEKRWWLTSGLPNVSEPK